MSSFTGDKISFFVHFYVSVCFLRTTALQMLNIGWPTSAQVNWAALFLSAGISPGYGGTVWQGSLSIELKILCRGRVAEDADMGSHIVGFVYIMIFLAVASALRKTASRFQFSRVCIHGDVIVDTVNRSVSWSVGQSAIQSVGACVLLFALLMLMLITCFPFTVFCRV